MNEVNSPVHVIFQLRGVGAVVRSDALLFCFRIKIGFVWSLSTFKLHHHNQQYTYFGRVHDVLFPNFTTVRRDRQMVSSAMFYI